jgi:hypothetical protein
VARGTVILGRRNVRRQQVGVGRGIGYLFVLDFLVIPGRERSERNRNPVLV